MHCEGVIAEQSMLIQPHVLHGAIALRWRHVSSLVYCRDVLGKGAVPDIVGHQYRGSGQLPQRWKWHAQPLASRTMLGHVFYVVDLQLSALKHCFPITAGDLGLEESNMHDNVAMFSYNTLS